MVRICYVCGNPIRENALGVGNDLYRHRSKCAPCTETFARWARERMKKQLKFTAQQVHDEIQAANCDPDGLSGPPFE